MSILHNEQHIGIKRVDFLVDGIMFLELKASSKLEDVHFA